VEKWRGVKFLVDTNIILEVLLGQQREEEVKDFFREFGDSEFYITDFALHSIGVILFHEEDQEGFNKFCRDMIMEGPLVVINLSEYEIMELSDVAEKNQMDFDDAYQYKMAEKSGLTILTYDSDFEDVPINSKTPAEILRQAK